MIEINLTILAVQAVTFLAAMFVLWKFMWGPFTQFLEKRKCSISGDIECARAGRQNAENLGAEYSALLENLKKERLGIIEKAKLEGEMIRKSIVSDAHEETRRMIAKAEKHLNEENEKAAKKLRAETVSLAVAIAEKILKESVGRKTQDELIKEFSEEISSGRDFGDRRRDNNG